MRSKNVFFLHDFRRNLSDDEFYHILQNDPAIFREFHFEVEGVFYTYRMREWQRLQRIEVAP